MIDKESLKSRIDLRDLVRETISLSSPDSSGECTGKCPFHDDREASFSVNATLFHCFAASCAASGDCFTWAERVWNCSFTDAMQRLNDWAGGVFQITAPPPPQKVPTLNPERAKEYHRTMPEERREWYRQRGLNDTTIDRFLLGWDGLRYTIPIFENDVLYNIKRRRDDANTKDHSAKYLAYSKGYGSARLFNGDVLKEAKEIIIAEGEFDVMILHQHGWDAVASTAGAETFDEDWVGRFAHFRDIFILYDNDDAGRSGARKVAKLFGERARIIELPAEVGHKGDVTDFFVTLGRNDTDFADLLNAARPFVQETPPEPAPELVHLAAATRSEYVGKRVTVNVLVAGKIDTPYIVPQKVTYSCSTDPNKCLFHEGSWDKTFDDSSTLLMECCHQKKETLQRIVQKEGEPCPGCRRVSATVRGQANVEQVLVVPMANRTYQQDGKERDESGQEYVQRTVYALETKLQVNQRYALTGRVHPDPKTQAATILVSEAKPLQDNIDQFRLTDELRRQFRMFQCHPEVDLVTHTENLLLDLTNHVTKIYKRDAALLAVLLGYHSVLSFPFEGRMIRRGWVEVLLLGDTGLGKSQIVRRIMEACELGAFSSGETMRRTGLTYALEQIGERWFVKWGKYPLSDRRLLAIDEMSELPEDDLKQMTQARNDGVIEVDRAGVGATYCRTRLIWMSNARGKKTLGDYAHGIEALRDLFPVPADQRRLDLVVFLSTDDVDLADINRVHDEPVEQMIPPAVLKASVLWAWSRKPGDVVLSQETYETILDEATRLSEKYGVADDVPLVSPSDMREKLARMAVAYAALVHATDETHEKVIVTPDHVEFVSYFLDSVYTAKNCRYDIYAQKTIESKVLTPAEAEEIWKKLRQLDNSRQTAMGETPRNLGEEIVRLFGKAESYYAKDIGDLLDIDHRTVTARFRIFQQHALLRRTRYGFQRTPKFIDFLEYTEMMAVNGQNDAELSEKVL